MSPLLTAALLFASTCLVVMALGLQSLNVNGGHRVMAVITSFFIGSSNLVLFKVLPGPTGWLEIAAYLLGGPVGILAAMALHPWLVARLKREPKAPHRGHVPPGPMPAPALAPRRSATGCPLPHVPQPSDFKPRERAAESRTLCQQLAQDLLDPEALGYAVSAEVRQRAARALYP